MLISKHTADRHHPPGDDVFICGLFDEQIPGGVQHGADEQ
jgi:hypothetical protein